MHSAGAGLLEHTFFARERHLFDLRARVAFDDLTNTFHTQGDSGHPTPFFGETTIKGSPPSRQARNKERRNRMSVPQTKPTQDPQIHWDGSKHRWAVVLPLEEARSVQAEWNQPVLTVLRIRKKTLRGEWSPGFTTPLFSAEFADLEPLTVYEAEMWHRNSAGDSPRRKFEFITDERGCPIKKVDA